ncbi:unknown [Roseburia sp. CAG:197]|nr:unknown [Roseburia sp. CAG:197]
MIKTNNVIFKIFIFIIVAIILILLAPRIFYTLFNVDNKLSTKETDILLLSQTYPTTFYFIGDTIPLDKSITTKNITVDEVSNITTSKKEWAMLVINDLNDDLPIREEQWKNIVDTVQNNSHINCMYLGNSDWDVMEKQGYFSGKEDLDDTDLSMGLIHQKTSVINTLGMLKADDDPDDLPALLLHEQAYDLQTSRT